MDVAGTELRYSLVDGAGLSDDDDMDNISRDFDCAVRCEKKQIAVLQF
jgi:hypothetical protein